MKNKSEYKNLLLIINHPDFDELLKFEGDDECRDLFKNEEFKERIEAIRSSNEIDNKLTECEISLIWTAYEFTYYDWSNCLFSIAHYMNYDKDRSSWWKFRDHRKGDDLFDQDEDFITEVYIVDEHLGLYEFRSSELSGDTTQIGPYSSLEVLKNELLKIVNEDLFNILMKEL